MSIPLPDKIIETIFAVGKGIFELLANIKGTSQEKRDQVANYLTEVASTIETTSAKLKMGQYPHKSCEEMRCHAKTMVKAIGGVVGKMEAEDLAAQLNEVWEIELLYNKIRSEKTVKQRSRSLKVLDQAAGTFRAAAAFARVRS